MKFEMELNSRFKVWNQDGIWIWEIQMEFENKLDLRRDGIENGIGFERNQDELDLKLEMKNGIGFEIWNPKWIWIWSLRSKMELDSKSGILNGIGSEVWIQNGVEFWNPKWNLDPKSGDPKWKLNGES